MNLKTLNSEDMSQLQATVAQIYKLIDDTNKRHKDEKGSESSLQILDYLGDLVLRVKQFEEYRDAQ